MHDFLPVAPGTSNRPVVSLQEGGIIGEYVGEGVGEDVGEGEGSQSSQVLGQFSFTFVKVHRHLALIPTQVHDFLPVTPGTSNRLVVSSHA